MMRRRWGVTIVKIVVMHLIVVRPLQKEHRGYSGEGGIMGMIEVCKSCRCEKCISPDWG